MVKALANKLRGGEATLDMVHACLPNQHLHDVLSHLVGLLPPEACTYKAVFTLFLYSADTAAIILLEDCKGDPTDDERDWLLFVTAPRPRAHDAVKAKVGGGSAATKTNTEKETNSDKAFYFLCWGVMRPRTLSLLPSPSSSFRTSGTHL